MIALVVMIVIAMLLIPQPLCSLWVAFSIASIDLGVIGFMTLWDVNLVRFLSHIKSEVILNFGEKYEVYKVLRFIKKINARSRDSRDKGRKWKFF